MALVRKKIDVTEKITKEQIEMLEGAEKRAIAFDEDNPPLSKEELARFKRVSETIAEEKKSSRKQNVTLRLSPQTISKAKAFGKGYTSVLSKIIEKALDNPAIAEQLIKQ
ncbi:MAG: BrnA antitoxin family protein [Lachnospiraceae bacterium]|nr:BrnA antitoxin family protein [Lachnospiraceae bacterium]